MSTVDCEFPHFRRKFWGAALWTSNSDSTPQVSNIVVSPNEHSNGISSPSMHHLQRPNLRTLDLKTLPREDGPPSESQLRRQKYLYYEKKCSEVADGLYLGGDCVAKTRHLLQECGITHVVNCVGFICQEYFKGELQYKTLYLHDTPAEDILCVLYDSFEFIDAARANGGRIFIHCSQGVSRSATIVIAYLMWKCNQSYEEVFSRVKAIRGVANPNIGFTCQLMQWQKRRVTAPTRPRFYRIAPHSPQAPLYLVPKSVSTPRGYPHPTLKCLDPRGAFIIHTSDKLYVWKGDLCPEHFYAAAQMHARLIQKYEVAPRTFETIVQGCEPADLHSLLATGPLEPHHPPHKSPSTLSIQLSGSRRYHRSSQASGASNLDMTESDCELGGGLENGYSPMDASSTNAAHSSMTGSGALSPASLPSPMRCETQENRLIENFRRFDDMCDSDSEMLPDSALRAASESCVSAGRVLPIEENDDYTVEYEMYEQAVRASSEGCMLIPDHVRSQMSAVTSMIPIKPVTPRHPQHLVEELQRPESPATIEGRLKKYRRSESERHLATASVDKPKNPNPWPSLHTSIDEEDMPNIP